MKFNFVITAFAAFIPFFIGLIWFSPRVFGKIWLKSVRLTPDHLRWRNMFLLFLSTYALSYLMAFILHTIVIPQYGFFTSIMSEPSWDQPGSDAYNFSQQYMARYGNNYRDFSYGLLRGAMSGLFFAFPVLGITAMYERRGYKFLFVTVSYWVLCLALMGGILAAFA